MNIYETLYLYMEQQLRGEILLSDEEVIQIEQALKSDITLQREAQEIRSHLLWLNGLPQPQPSKELARRCLQATQKQQRGHFTWRIPVYGVTLALVLLMVFTYIPEQTTPIPNDEPPQIVQLETEAFPLLMQKQQQLVSEIEQLGKQRLSSTFNPIQGTLFRLDRAGKYLEVYYQDIQDDYNAKRALSVALYQNILALEALKESIKSNTSQSIRATTEIPDHLDEDTSL